MTTLVTPAWLRDHAGEVRIVDARTAEDYAKGHIPGAINIDLFALHWWDSTPAGLPGIRAFHEAAFSTAGLRREDTVVWVENTSGMLAARGFFLSELFGQEAHILDGGLRAWQAAGNPLTTEPTTLPATTYTAEWHPAAIAGIEDVRAAIGTSTILDTRTAAEYTGTNVRAKHGGAVPGAIHLDYSNNTGPDGTYNSPESLRAMYEAAGITPDQAIITYCHGGYRAASALVALREAGYPNVKMYVSSWGEWGNRDDTPIEKPTS